MRKPERHHTSRFSYHLHILGNDERESRLDDNQDRSQHRGIVPVSAVTDSTKTPYGKFRHAFLDAVYDMERDGDLEDVINALYLIDTTRHVLDRRQAFPKSRP